MALLEATVIVVDFVVVFVVVDIVIVFVVVVIVVIDVVVVALLLVTDHMTFSCVQYICYCYCYWSYYT